MTTITLNPREFWSLAIGGAVLCFVAGVLMACLTVAVVVLPLRDTQADQRVESAFTKGAMVKISAAKARCQQWELKARKAVCDE
ncbi:hypothetical protein [Aquidulcibacter sp.]|uniref:hypothetical protein n=1 Tax=Aquidulcibacter sp. TaxID=2052990 RepID=UPI0025C16D2F|nr:hypothetical protein [Aquidulcibacter sp.]MCA3064014.1 hypothetical protein [Rhodocyclaceae bacterium]MCA3694226.1 hypothetical protein [Aquidulcibacter sp.]